MTAAHAVGMIGALFLLAGRWSFARITGDAATSSLISEPRTWLVVVLALLVVAQAVRPGAWKRLRIEWCEMMLLAMFGYLLTSFAWVTHSDATSEKAAELALMAIGFLLLAVGRSIYNRQRVDTGFWTTLLAFGLMLALLSLSASVTGGSISPGGGPITFGRNMGFMAMAAWRLAERNSHVHRLGSGIIIALAILLIVTSGSRGALLAATAGGFVLVLFANLPSSQKALAVGAIAAMATAAMQFTSAGRNAREVFEHRIVEVTFEQQHMAGRDDLWATAIEMFVERPIWGWGINGFRENSWHYPHNLFLEVGVEGGSICLALLTLSLFVWAFRWRRCRWFVYSGSVAAMTVAFFSAQTSGNLYDTRCLFLMMVMASPVPMSAVAAGEQEEDETAELGRQSLAA